MLFMADALSFESVTVDTISSFFNNTFEADVLRLDKISHLISGNKWFKLRYYLAEAINNQKKGILTFGGAWSNHIVATAAICREYGLKSIGIIRGEETEATFANIATSQRNGNGTLFYFQIRLSNQKNS